MMMQNRQWVLANRPRGLVQESDFEHKTDSVSGSDLNPGEVLIRTLLLSFDPAMRGWLNDAPSYIPPVAIGEVMRASGVGEVIASENPDIPTGALVTGMLGWQEYSIGRPTDWFPPTVVPDDVPLSLPLSVFGGTGLTAYFGLLFVGQPKPGETVLVSGAAGATGSMAAQIAQLKGCDVVGTAGGAEKCSWLQSDCGIDKVIDYKADDLDQRLREFCPNGVDVFFDNVGGQTLETAFNHMSDFGRVVMCGAISVYNNTTPAAGPNNLTQIIVKRLRVQGFTTLDFIDRRAEALSEIQQWVQQGQLAWREDIQEGFENIPNTLNRLFAGENKGKQLLRVAQR